MGLGDMNYSRYNNMGQTTDQSLDTRLHVISPAAINPTMHLVACFSTPDSKLSACQERMGGIRIYKRGVGDDSC